MCGHLWSSILLGLALIMTSQGLSAHLEHIRATSGDQGPAFEHLDYSDAERTLDREVYDKDLLDKIQTGRLSDDEVRAAHDRIFMELRSTKKKSVVCPELNDVTFTNDPPFDVLGVPGCQNMVQPKLVLFMKPKPESRHSYPKKDVLEQSRQTNSLPTKNVEKCELMPYQQPNKQTDSCFQKLEERTDITKVVFITHGFTQSFKTTWLHSMREDIMAMEPTTAVVIMGWGRGLIDFLSYSIAARNSRYAAQVVYMTVASLQRVVKRDVFVHCIGHSLGAHVCGLTGKLLNADKSTKKLNRISGMDPAGPMFCNDVPYPYNYKNILPGARLDAGDAILVDVIHTDGGRLSSGMLPQYGTLEALGTVDFYVGSGENYGKSQPGCDSEVASCSHSRVVDLYTATIKDTNCRASKKCNGDPHQIPKDCALINDSARDAKEQKKPILGYWLDTRNPPSGLYTVDVGSNAPYCAK